MTKKSANLYDSISLVEATDLIAATGTTVTYIVEGEMGIGKSSILKELTRRFPDFYPCYVDMTTKDVGDFIIPKIRTVDGEDTCSFIPNEELGFHLKNKKVIMMLDEIGKVKGAVANACNRLVYERKLGTYSLPEGSIVFATTNLSSEAIGDNVPPHASNRVVRIKVRKPTADEWINNYAMHKGIEAVVIAAVKEFPDMLASFEDYETPGQNPYIYDARSPRRSFVTHRSLETASNIYKASRSLSHGVISHAIAGAVGVSAMNNILTMIQLNEDVPEWDEIVANPESCSVPKKAAAVCMLVVKAVQRVEKDTLEQWVAYMGRLPMEAQGLFARTILSAQCPKKEMAFTNRYLAKWAVENKHLFTSK